MRDLIKLSEEPQTYKCAKNENIFRTFNSTGFSFKSKKL